MSSRQAAPQGWHTVTPRLVAKDAEALVEFIRHVFEAQGTYDESAPSILTLGDSKLMISSAGQRTTASAFLYIYVQDVSSVYRRAIASGAESVESPFDTPYGDHRCMFKDAWGNTWQAARRSGA
jgi:uncharacterized glyoxalase superfamily protein PhnB